MLEYIIKLKIFLFFTIILLLREVIRKSYILVYDIYLFFIILICYYNVKVKKLVLLKIWFTFNAHRKEKYIHEFNNHFKSVKYLSKHW